MQMPGTTDPNGPPADARELIPTPSQIDVKGAAGTTTSPSVSLYNTNTSPDDGDRARGATMGPQFNLQPTVTENVSAPPYGTPVPQRGATAAAPITFTVPAGLDRLEMSEITPDPTNNTMLQIYLLDPQGRLVQDSYDDGSTAQGITTLGPRNGCRRDQHQRREHQQRGRGQQGAASTAWATRRSTRSPRSARPRRPTRRCRRAYRTSARPNIKVAVRHATSTRGGRHAHRSTPVATKPRDAPTVTTVGTSGGARDGTGRARCTALARLHARATPRRRRDRVRRGHRRHAQPRR